MFPLYSVLRYQPANETGHYTAMIMEDGVWQMKGQTGNRTLYPSVTEWLTTLPGSPDPSALQVSTKLAEDEQRREDLRIDHAKQAASKKKTKWNVPRLKSMARSLPWARHIYSMIRECDPTLLTRDDMRDAYNQLVQFLTDHANELRTSMIRRRFRYERGIQIHSGVYRAGDIIYPLLNVTTQRYTELFDMVQVVYQPLYAILQETVVPFMERKRLEKQRNADLKIYRRRRDQYVKQMMKLTEKYEKDAAWLRNQMERYQSYIDQIEQTP